MVFYKSKFSILVLFFLFAFKSNGQADRVIVDDEYSLNIKIGLSEPTGDFADDDLNNPKAGISKTGINVGVALNIQASSKSFVIFDFTYMSNPIREELLTNSFKSNLQAGLDFSLSTSNWNTTNFAVGFGLTIPVDEAVDFKPYFKVGLAGITSPEIITRVSNGSQTERIIQSEATGIGLSYAVGARAELPFGNNINLILEGEYLSTRAEFDDGIISVEQNNVIVENEQFEFSQNLKLFNLSAGLAFKL